MAIGYKLFTMTIIFMLLAACGSVEGAATAVPPAPSPSPQPEPTNESTATAVPTTLPSIDGVLSPNEWEAAEITALSDGSELFLMQDDDNLYLGIRSITPEMIGANVFVEEGGQVRILHTSAALGTAIYQQGTNNWQQIQDFDWQCRNTGSSAAAQAERAAYLQENHWLAANSRMGTPNELEYQIELSGASQHIAVSLFRSSAPNERVFWPPTLDDDSIKPTPGGLSENLYLSLEQWIILEVE